MDKAGRKALLVPSCLIMFICTITMGTYFYLRNANPQLVAGLNLVPVITLCLYVFTNSFGLGPVTFVMIGEIFAQNVKDIASAITMSLNYGLSVLVTLLFPLIANAYGFGAAFYCCGFFIGLSCLFMVFMVPETKGKSFQEIQKMFK